MSRRRKQPRRKQPPRNQPRRKPPRRDQSRPRNAQVPGRAIRQANARLEHVVRQHGWMIQYVGGPDCEINSCDCSTGDGPPFAYTVGLFGFGHPELLIFSVTPQVAASVLNAIGESVRAGDPLADGHVVHVDGWGHRIVCEEVPNPGDIVFIANDFYRRRPEHSVPVLQMTYDDDNGAFPWEEAYTGDEQPRPGSFQAMT